MGIGTGIKVEKKENILCAMRCVGYVPFFSFFHQFFKFNFQFLSHFLSANVDARVGRRESEKEIEREGEKIQTFWLISSALCGAAVPCFVRGELRAIDTPITTSKQSWFSERSAKGRRSTRKHEMFQLQLHS